MATLLEIAWVCLVLALVIAGMVGFCVVAWRRRITSDPHLEPHGEASLLGRDEL